MAGTERSSGCCLLDSASGLSVSNVATLRLFRSCSSFLACEGGEGGGAVLMVTGKFVHS